MTYCEAIDNLSALCESIMIDYEYAVITEATDFEGNDSRSKTENAKENVANLAHKIKMALLKLWEVVKSLINKIKSKIQAFIVAKKGSEQMILNDAASANDEIVLSGVILDPKKALKVALQAKYAVTKGYDTAVGDNGILDTIDELLQDKKVSIKQKFGTAAQYFELAKVLEQVAMDGSKAAMTINTTLTPEQMHAKQTIHNKVAAMFRAFGRDFNKLTLPSEIFNKQPEKAKDARRQQRDQDMHQMANDITYGNKKALGESATYADLMKLRAELLVEAAEACATVAHTMTDDTPQKDIEDIPEEKPVVDKEYPEDVSGGEGLREDNLEDTKELIDNDSDAMDIMTKDEDSKTITEAIDLVFDL